MEMVHRGFTNLCERAGGPMSFRFILQPLMATLFAVRDGIKDALTETSPYFWTIVKNPQERRQKLTEGVRAVLKVMLVGTTLDIIYQLKFLKAFYPLETVCIVLFLAFIPYLVFRGPACRIARHWTKVQ